MILSNWSNILKKHVSQTETRALIHLLMCSWTDVNNYLRQHILLARYGDIQFLPKLSAQPLLDQKMFNCSTKRCFTDINQEKDPISLLKHLCKSCPWFLCSQRDKRKTRRKSLKKRNRRSKILFFKKSLLLLRRILKIKKARTMENQRVPMH